MSRSRIVFIVVCAAVAFLAGALGTPSLVAQGSVAGQGSGSSSDVAVAALVSEVRALRGELGEASRNSLRSQLLLARLQIQEQRVMYLDRQRAEVSSRAAAAAQRRLEAASALRMMEGPSGDASSGRGAQGPAAPMLREFRAQVALHESTERQLRAEEMQILSAVSEEQARWTDFNARLDDLERSLSAR